MKPLIEKGKFKNIKKTHTKKGEEITIGDSVEVITPGCQYDCYDDAFIHFKFKNSEDRKIKKYNTIGTVIGIAVHPRFSGTILVAIETEEGEQFVLASEGLSRIKGKSDKILHEIALRHFVSELKIVDKEKLWDLIKQTRIQDLEEVQDSHYLHNVHKADIIRKTDVYGRVES